MTLLITLGLLMLSAWLIAHYKFVGVLYVGLILLSLIMLFELFFFLTDGVPRIMLENKVYQVIDDNQKLRQVTNQKTYDYLVHNKGRKFADFTDNQGMEMITIMLVRMAIIILVLMELLKIGNFKCAELL